MNKIILADSQVIFRAGTAKVLAMDEDLHIVAQCGDVERMMHAVTTFPGAIVLFASELHRKRGFLAALFGTCRRVKLDWWWSAATGELGWRQGSRLGEALGFGGAGP